MCVPHIMIQLDLVHVIQYAQSQWIDLITIYQGRGLQMLREVQPGHHRD